MTVLMTWLKRIGAKRVICASTGNTAASTALYARRAGIEAIVIVPRAYTAKGKLDKMLAYGATVVLVDGDFDDAFRLAKEASSKFGIPMSNSTSPWRLLGQQMIAVEICETFGWNPPDWIILPGGNLGNVSAIYKGLKALHDLKIISRLPHLGVIQASGSAPFVRAFRDHQTSSDLSWWPKLQKVQAETMATAIKIGYPANYRRACKAIDETNGFVDGVDDNEIMTAHSILAREIGGSEPASAAPLAGVRRMATTNMVRVVRPDQQVVLIATGHALNDPEALNTGLSPNQPILVDHNLVDFEFKIINKKS
jgi:threonine synthase